LIHIDKTEERLERPVQYWPYLECTLLLIDSYYALQNFVPSLYIYVYDYSLA